MIYELKVNPNIVAVVKADLFEKTAVNVYYDHYKNGKLDKKGLILSKNVFNSIYKIKE